MLRFDVEPTERLGQDRWLGMGFRSDAEDLAEVRERTLAPK
jgi:hypothetical protein